MFCRSETFEARLRMIKDAKTILTVGTRPSRLAVTQARGALDRMGTLLPGITLNMVTIASIGDSDRTTDLRESPADFFTRELDNALLKGEIDCAIHSAKDLPDPLPNGIDWFWLPWREEPRDALVLAKGKTLADLPAAPIIGVSSERRGDYCTKHFPNGIQKTIRGNIEERIAQVDDGSFDVIIMAAAALLRLGIEERISEWIPLSELEVPEGQGYLAVTFRENDERMKTLRTLFMQSVTFAGAGVGHRDLCTLATIQALQRADICLYDSLIDHQLLDELPPHAQAIDVGKRCGAHSKQQHETTALISLCARQSKRIVRLKGGDPGIFGRLAEETDALEQLGIPFRVIPGISALQAATTGTGMLLTRRNVSRGFVALTPRQSGGTLAPCNTNIKSKLPVIYYMSIKAAETISTELLADGWAPETPAALIFNAGGDNETLLRTRLEQLAETAAAHRTKLPGLILVGEITNHTYSSKLGALRGKRVLLTCSEALQEKAADCVRDYGGRPVPYPLIRLKCRQNVPLNCANYDWLVITSPSSVRCFMEIVRHQKIDYRTIPKIMVCGRGTAAELEKHNLHADAQPEADFSAKALLALAKSTLKPGEKILRLRSEKAGSELADALRGLGANVDDTIIYDNEPIIHTELPDFDAVFFASASGVESFLAQWGTDALAGKTTVVIGQPTAEALNAANLTPDVMASEATVPAAIQSLSGLLVVQAIEIPRHPNRVGKSIQETQ